jgi:hypothetical protein
MEGLNDSTGNKKINRCMEDYLFEKSIELETRAHQLSQGLGYHMSERSTELNKDRYKDSVAKFIGHFTNRPIGESDRKYSIFEIVCATLQMMDAGLMSVVTDECNGIVSQQVRFCEQALSTPMKRYYCQLDILDDLDNRVQLTEKEKLNCLKLYIEKLHSSGYDVEESAEDLYTVYRQMCSAGQRIKYWMVGMNRHFIIQTSGETTEGQEGERGERYRLETKKPSSQSLRWRYKNIWDTVVA